MSRAVFDHLELRTGDDAGGDTVAREHLDAMAVPGIERLVFLAVVAKQQATVGQYAIDVE